MLKRALLALPPPFWFVYLRLPPAMDNKYFASLLWGRTSYGVPSRHVSKWPRQQPQKWSLSKFKNREPIRNTQIGIPNSIASLGPRKTLQTMGARNSKSIPDSGPCIDLDPFPRRPLNVQTIFFIVIRRCDVPQNDVQGAAHATSQSVLGPLRWLTCMSPPAKSLVRCTTSSRRLWSRPTTGGGWSIPYHVREYRDYRHGSNCRRG